MDPGVENIIDLGLVNYVRHPTNPNFIVFRFADKKRADQFEEALTEHKIWFEKGEEQGRTKFFYLYGVRSRDYKKVQAINFSVEGKHRKFIIANKFLRWGLVVFFIGVCSFAFIGYLTRPDVIQRNYIEQQYNDSIQKSLNNPNQ
jgi:hypothetical protein